MCVFNRLVDSLSFAKRLHNINLMNLNYFLHALCSESIGSATPTLNFHINNDYLLVDLCTVIDLSMGVIVADHCGMFFQFYTHTHTQKLIVCSASSILTLCAKRTKRLFTNCKQTHLMRNCMQFKHS